MTPHEHFLSRRQRYQPIALPPDVSEDDLARDWTLSDDDRAEIGKYSKQFRLSLAIQLCAVRVYGRFFTPIQDISPRITNYLGNQLGLPPVLRVSVPLREATALEHRQYILRYLGFRKFDEEVQGDLATWLTQHAQRGGSQRRYFPKPNSICSSAVSSSLVPRSWNG